MKTIRSQVCPRPGQSLKKIKKFKQRTELTSAAIVLEVASVSMNKNPTASFCRPVSISSFNLLLISRDILSTITCQLISRLISLLPSFFLSFLPSAIRPLPSPKKPWYKIKDLMEIGCLVAKWS